MTDKLIFEAESIGGRTIRVLRDQNDGEVTVAIVDDPPILNLRGDPIDFDVVLTGEDATAMARALLAGSDFTVVRSRLAQAYLVLREREKDAGWQESPEWGAYQEALAMCAAFTGCSETELQDDMVRKLGA